MKIASFWVSIALLAPQALAEATTTSATSTISTAAAATCTASLIASLCDYTEPDEGTAVASDGAASCWEYCNDNPPCDFVIFLEGNPYLGTGTCWLYPGETYDESQGSSEGCNNPYLDVYDKPECSGGSPTSTAGACEATASPSAIASVCGYPTPGDDCFYDCAASSGASHCLSMCAERDACNYVVFNPHNPSNSPYRSGTCWMYPNGTYDADAASDCDGEPEQFVYDNVCPKPSPSPSSSEVASSTSVSSSPTESSSGTESATPTSGIDSTAIAAEEGTTTDENSAPSGISLTMPLAMAMGVAMVMWQAL
ncbi:hypothetical protein BJX68DRAFT_238824 [Aspergillus pseudodeflectus]|uniref:Apple domain-containing protein n=1 Tax=Aspergillus pseudodeflectus TaxID=176178 RepID=A0ABR4K7J9_9EURO